MKKRFGYSLNLKALLLVFILAFNFSSCDDELNCELIPEITDPEVVPPVVVEPETPEPEPEKDPDPNPQIVDPNVVLPDPKFDTEDDAVIIEMAGLMAFESDKYLDLNGTGHPQQNIWVEVDGIPRKVSVERERSEPKKIDIVFLVDNSGSMNEEADSIASSIKQWVNYLGSYNLDLRIGAVGYKEDVQFSYIDENGRNSLKPTNISGAMNLDTSDEFINYLNRGTGLQRTRGFRDKDKDQLVEMITKDPKKYTVTEENGVQALRFADDNFNFRPDVERVYLNFTDEPNQSPHYISIGGGNLYERSGVNSVKITKDPERWPSWRGTIHSIFSADSTTFTFVEQGLSLNERPWRMSENTGGTSAFTSADFEGVNLMNLPLTEAIVHTYRLKIYGLPSIEGEHNVKITILSDDKATRTEKTFEKVVFKK